MIPFLSIYGTAALVILGMMVALWLLSLYLKDSSIVDIFWGAGFVVTAWVYFYLTPDGFVIRKLLIASLTTIWGLRLSIHILLRNWGHGEDFRYQKWREESGGNWWWYSFFKVFALQGLLMWIISIPLLAAQFSSTPSSLIWLDYLGIIVWGMQIRITRANCSIQVSGVTPAIRIILAMQPNGGVFTCSPQRQVAIGRSSAQS
jgi:steroid 5-alpha reductase family enzyme